MLRGGRHRVPLDGRDVIPGARIVSLRPSAGAPLACPHGAPAGRSQPTTPVGAPVNESTTLTNRERRENVAFLGQAFAADPHLPAEVLDADERARFLAEPEEQPRPLLQVALLRRLGRPAGARVRRRRRLASHRGRRRRRRPVRRRVRPHALRRRSSRLAQRQQGQDHRLRAAGRGARDVGAPAAAADRSGRRRRRPARGLRRSPQVARLLGRARDAPAADSGRTTRSTASPASPTGACASAPCAWGSSTCPRKPTRSPT